MSVPGAEGNGDLILDHRLKRLWDLTYSCLHKFGSPVMFEIIKSDRVKQMDQQIIFLVSRTSERAQEVIEYLGVELSDYRYQSRTVENKWHPGCQVHILEFDGIDFFATKEDIEQATQRLMDALMKRRA